MARWRSRRPVYYFALVVVTTVVFTLVYDFGMSAWEGRERPLYRSLEVVVQSFTTTGYGEDAPWTTPQMNLLMITMQLAGIGLILTAADVFAVPWLRSALSPSVPTEAPDLADHVVICGHTARGEAFVSELRSRDREYVVVVADAETATELHEADYRVVHGDPESTDVLERASVGTARAVVADAPDDVTASVVLSAREVNPDVQIVTLVEDAELETYHRIAGADDVLSPRRLLGESLARQVPTAVAAVGREGVDVGDDIELVELTVERGSDLWGQSVAAAGLRERFGVDVIGAWTNGTFETAVDPERELGEDTRLLVAGEPARIDAFRDAATAPVEPFAPRRVVIAGYGDAGTVTASMFDDTSTEVTVLDVEDKQGVDVVGDACDPAALREAGIADAATVIVTVGDDTTAVFTTLVARDLDPDLTILARANEEGSVPKLYRAGADYVQSLATTSGRMLATTVFEDEEVLAFDTRIEVVKLAAAGLAGQTLAGADVRERTGCTVLAVERGEQTITALDAESFVFEHGDEVVVAGTDEDVRAFEAAFVE
ncbi:potassium transporter [Halobacteriales archaeon QS_1_68_20]|nr:MAG: potassium transporter [Halobacteriales archaeon QS_1_68_20]